MNVAWTQAAEGLPRRAFTVEDVRRMVDIGILAEDERIELVEGEFVVMAAKGYAHEMVKKAFVRAVVLAAESRAEVGVEMTIQFSPDVLLEPDLAVLKTGGLLKSGAGYISFAPGDCLLIIEIAVSSLNYDKGRKAALYARLGVEEFWVIDANERVAWIHTGPSDAGWSSIAELGSDDVLTTPALPGLSIRLGELG